MPHQPPSQTGSPGVYELSVRTLPAEKGLSAGHERSPHTKHKLTAPTSLSAIITGPTPSETSRMSQRGRTRSPA